jgi:dienelactone hydrolase
MPVMLSPNSSILIPAGTVQLPGNLEIPNEAQGIIIFAHSSGMSRHSPRNRAIAQALREAGLATLLLALLTPEEEEIDRRTRHFHCDIPLLVSRLIAVTDWIRQNPATGHLKIGYFGASTGSAAAIVAAALRSNTVEAIVSCSGRVDFVDSALLSFTFSNDSFSNNLLSNVQAPTLLIVGGEDFPVIGASEDALNQLQAVKRLAIVPGASHLFEEPGALEEVTQLAREWFKQYLN